MTEVTRKQCSNCKDWKPLEDFHKEKSKPLGVQSKCKFCKREEGLARRQKLAEEAANGDTKTKGGPDGQESDEGIPAQ